MSSPKHLGSADGTDTHAPPFTDFVSSAGDRRQSPGGQHRRAGSAIQSGTSYSAPTVPAIAAMMLSVSPKFGWRDVQEILADSSYMPPPTPNRQAL